MTSAAKLRVGIVGLGMAGGLMVPYVLAHPRTTLAAAADRDEHLRARLSHDHGVPVHDDVQALLERDDVDAVYIATPHEFHRAHSVAAAEHGKHVVVEKPMALTLADCDAMIEAAHRHRVALLVGHTHSFDPAIAEIRRLQQAGGLGELAMLVMSNYTDFLYRPRRPEELDTSRGGGILFNQIPHQVDIARYLADSPLASVRASAYRLDPARATEGASLVMMEFANGASASLAYSGYDHFDSDEVYGWVSSSGRPKAPRHGATRRALASLSAGEVRGDAQGEARVDAESRQRIERYGYGGAAWAQAGGRSHQPHFGSLVATFQHADIRTVPAGLAIYRHDGMVEVTLDNRQDGRSRVLDELAGAVLDGSPPEHDGQFGRATLEATLAIQASARERREIRLDGRARVNAQ